MISLSCGHPNSYEITVRFADSIVNDDPRIAVGHHMTGARIHVFGLRVSDEHFWPAPTEKKPIVKWKPFQK